MAETFQQKIMKMNLVYGSFIIGDVQIIKSIQIYHMMCIDTQKLSCSSDLPFLHFKIRQYSA